MNFFAKEKKFRSSPPLSQPRGWKKKSFLGKDEGLSFFLHLRLKSLHADFVCQVKLLFVVYETLASLFQFLFCSITIQFATTRRHARKWLFMSFSRQFSRKKPGEKESPWKKESWSFDSRGKPWFSLTSAEVDSASEWIRANGFREDYIEGKDDFAVKRHTREGTKPRSILDYFYLFSTLLQFLKCIPFAPF